MTLGFMLGTEKNVQVNVTFDFPSIWQAGLTSELNSNHLVIALEPEAASLYCRTLNPKKFALSAQKIEAEEGTKYLVLDAGGEYSLLFLLLCRGSFS